MFPSPGTRQKSGSAFPAGTLMLFQQTVAPLGWTKQITHNDKALRVVSGNVSSGGTNSFSSVMAQTVVGNTTISTATLPAHTHNFTIAGGAGGGSLAGGFVTPVTSEITDGGTGAGGSHNHTISMNIQFVDLIIARKN